VTLNTGLTAVDGLDVQSDELVDGNASLAATFLLCPPISGLRYSPCESAAA